MLLLPKANGPHKICISFGSCEMFNIRKVRVLAFSWRQLRKRAGSLQRAPRAATHLNTDPRIQPFCDQRRSICKTPGGRGKARRVSPDPIAQVSPSRVPKGKKCRRTSQTIVVIKGTACEEFQPLFAQLHSRPKRF